MCIMVIPKNMQNMLLAVRGAVLCITLILAGVSGITGCSNSSSRIELPEDFIKEFIAKHETMVDKSLVYYYAKEDQPMIARQIETACRINKSKGTLEMLENVTFDFSGLRIHIVDKKEEYLNDEPVVFVKVGLKGSYKMQLPEVTRKIDANEIIILQMAHHEWKVTKSRNPWS